MPEDYHKSIVTAYAEFEKISQGKTKDIDWDKTKPFYSHLAKDVGVQKKRIGGNFAVAQAINSQEQRDLIRTILPEVIFITLSLTPENQKKRVVERHGEASLEMLDVLCEFFTLFEGPGKDEKNIYDVSITEDMTPKDVLNKVLEVLDKHSH